MERIFTEEELNYLHVTNGEYVIDEKTPGTLKEILRGKLNKLAELTIDNYKYANF